MEEPEKKEKEPPKKRKNRSFEACPASHKVMGTMFLVDGLSWGRKECQAFFLSHWHSDHYGGYRGWASRGKQVAPLLCSTATARLAAFFMKRKFVSIEPNTMLDMEQLAGELVGVPLGSSVMILGTRVSFMYVWKGKVGVALREVGDKKHICVPGVHKGVVFLGYTKELCFWGTQRSCSDANHCPGAAMFLFECEKGNYLHCGDFRFCTTMRQEPLLQKLSLTALYLDTTFLKPGFNFPPQEKAVKYVVEEVKKARANNARTLVCVGAYTIGKEKVVLGIARELNVLIYVNKEKATILQLAGVDMHCFTADFSKSFVIFGGETSHDGLCALLAEHTKRFDCAIAFRPTGWGGRKEHTESSRWTRFADPSQSIPYETTVHSVPYSEHCSSTELRDFVRWLRPPKVIPTVGGASEEQQLDWLADCMDNSGNLGRLDAWMSPRKPARKAKKKPKEDDTIPNLTDPRVISEQRYRLKMLAQEKEKPLREKRKVAKVATPSKKPKRKGLFKYFG